MSIRVHTQSRTLGHLRSSAVPFLEEMYPCRFDGDRHELACRVIRLIYLLLCVPCIRERHLPVLQTRVSWMFCFVVKRGAGSRHGSSF